MSNRIDFSEFRQLLQSLENSDVRFRLRGLGETWTPFSRLILLSESAMILQCDDDRRIILNLKNVIELQLEKAFLTYDAKTRYEVTY